MNQFDNKDGWKTVRLDGVVEKREENDRENACSRFDVFVKGEHLDPESLHIRRIGSQEHEELPPSFYKIFRRRQILFMTRRPYLRKNALAHFDGICGEKMLTLQVKEEIAEPRLIPFLFHSENFYNHTTGAMIGSTNPHCRWRDVAKYEFLLPPMDQQKRLAKLLWAADGAVESSLELSAKLSIHNSRVITDAIKNIEATAQNTLPLSQLYQEKFRSIDPATFSDTEVLHYSLPSFDAGETPEFVSASSIKSNKLLIDKPAILFSKLNPALPKVWKVDGDSNFLRLGSTEWLPLRGSAELELDYIFAYVNSDTFRAQVMRLVQGSSNSHQRINPKPFYQLSLPHPDRKERARIVRLSEAVQESQKHASRRIGESRQLLKSLINKIF